MTASASPRKICACAAPVSCSAPARAGFPEFRLADLQVHGDLLAVARDDAQLILNKDPDLDTDRGQALRILLYLFERDAAVKYLRSG